MRKPVIIGSIIAALVLGIAIGYFIRAGTADNTIIVDTQRPSVNPQRPAVARSTTMGDDHQTWENVPPTSPGYATAQRLLGYNYFAHDKHDFVEAKRHVDIALAKSPDDPKVLEDAGRVYVLAGFTEQGTAMLKKADTPVARDFLSRH